MDKVIESRLSPEGRISIPAELRQRMGLEPGDSVHFLISAEGDVRLSTAKALAEQVWANNTGGDAVDAGDVVRAVRESEDPDSTWSDEPFESDQSAEEAALLAILFPAGQ